MGEIEQGKLVFAFDDSDVTINGIEHTILAGVGTRTPEAISKALVELKSQFGIPESVEVKWNGMKVQLAQREREMLSQELLCLLHEATPIVIISEGADHQLAAEHAARQLEDFLKACPYWLDGNPTVSLVFDEGIISCCDGYRSFLDSNFAVPISGAQFTSVKSHENPLVQLADIAAGFNRLLTEICLGRPNKQIQVFDDGFGTEVEVDLDSYVSISQRWSVWGYVPPPPDPENITFEPGRWPYKHVGGYSLRIVSSIPEAVVKAIYDSRIVYMGCMH